MTAEKFNYGDQDTAAAHVVGFRDISLWNDEESLRYLNLKKIGGNYCEAFDSIHNRDFQGNVRGVEKGSDWVLEKSSARLRDSIRVGEQVDEMYTRPLLVVAVRGSVSWADWLMDVGIQFTNHGWQTFYDGSNAVYQTLYGTGEANNCPECHGNDSSCIRCKGYIVHYSLDNPLVLITGHSLGAAIVNITATRLNNDVIQPQGETPAGAENVFAYAFATPNTVDESVLGTLS